MNLSMIVAGLRETGIPTAAHAWTRPPEGSYLVCSLDGIGDRLMAEGRQVGTIVEGSVDLFSRTEGREVATIEGALAGLGGLTYRLNAVQFENSGQLLHMEWVFCFVDEDGDPVGHDDG